MVNRSADKKQLIRREVLAGLQKPQKRLPSKYLYDKRGSQLFEQITEVKEYYLTRTELSILRHNLSQITQCFGENTVLVEPGSGSSKKTKLLLNELPNLKGYIPIDISEQHLADTVQELKQEYPTLLIKPVCADYTKSFQLPEESDINYIAFFPGSTIGNFKPSKAKKFLHSIAQVLNPNGGMLIGVDLQKDKKTLEAAYNDKKGLTAAFNKNILRHINSELNANFNTDHFEHRAFYNQSESRMEMHLVSDIEQVATIDGKQIYFDKGETIHTENSYKYTLDSFDELVSPPFSVQQIWTDEKDYFSIQYLTKQ